MDVDRGLAAFELLETELGLLFEVDTDLRGPVGVEGAAVA
jgi:hypothetical protein